MQVIELCTPHGFGKTTQLAEWHREALLAGEAAIWLSLGERDDSARLIQGLTNAAMRVGRRDFFSTSFAEWIGGSSSLSQALTAWLYEIAQSHQETLLLLDDVDRLPEEARSEVIDYLLANAPSNLRIAISTRPNATVDSSGILGSTPLMRLTARELRFDVAETSHLVERSLDKARGTDLGVRIHRLSGGWPLGVRLGIASQLRSGEPVGPEISIAADIRKYFRDRVIAPLPRETVDMLAGMARFDPIHADLCVQTLGGEDPGALLEQLADESPILTRSENGEWMRLHEAARDVLIELEARIDPARRRSIAQLASEWYAARGLYEAGAAQARLCGDREGGLGLVEMSLREMTSQGRTSEVLEWYDRMPLEDFLDRPKFWPATAWALGMSDRAAEARKVVDQIIDRPQCSEHERFEANLILGAICSYEDDFLGLEDIQRSSGGAPASALPSELLIHAICKASLTLMSGFPDQARAVLASASQHSAGLAKEEASIISPVSRGFAATLVGLCYLWEGKPQLAHDLLIEAQREAEGALDRWSRITSMISVCLAQACLDLGHIEEASRHLALRLPIVEKQGLPDVVLAAHLVKAKLYEAEGRQDRAEDQLASLMAVGARRNMVRLSAAASAELVQMQARNGRLEVAEAELKRLQGAILGNVGDVSRSVQRWLDLQLQLARAALATAHDGELRLREGKEAAERAGSLAAQINRVRDQIKAKFLLARCLDKLGDQTAIRHREEAVRMCEAAGLKRLLELNKIEIRPRAEPEQAAKLILAQSAAELPGRTFLTPREMEVLELLTEHLSNKEIALAMGLGEETVKWHLKNLFQKLETSSRRIAVVRARSLGII